MGYYLETPDAINKADQLVAIYSAQRISQPKTFAPAPDKVIVCVVENVGFDAAAICYNIEEFDEFAWNDDRPKKWLLMNKSVVVRLIPRVEDMLE